MTQDTAGGGRNFGPRIPPGPAGTSVHPALYNFCVRAARTGSTGIERKTLVLLGALGAVSVVLLGAYFWLALLLCALLYAATGGSGGPAARARPAAALGACALLLAMMVVIADRGGVLGEGMRDTEPGYTAEVLEEGVFANGAEGLRVQARTEAASEDRWRELVSEIGRENGDPDFLWVDVVDEATGEPRAVVAVFATEAAAGALNDPSVGPTGGDEGDGVYVFGPGDLERLDYSPGMTVLEPA